MFGSDSLKNTGQYFKFQIIDEVRFQISSLFYLIFFRKLGIDSTWKKGEECVCMVIGLPDVHALDDDILSSE